MPEPIRPPLERRPDQHLPERERETTEGERPPDAGSESPPPVEVAPAPIETIPSSVAVPVPSASTKSVMLQRVEKILEEDLAQVYFMMNTEEQSRFKLKGEETANAVESLLSHAKATAARLIQLLRAWFQLIPGVSKFFVERESKIKTDKLLRLQRK
ncbi:hypothetical protein HY629_00895 [Candidatus Uhrbacteria bacterium]|nr:hypothetical protein [Candidatus Uhrbacteria bacterium]